jgi:hypothetical protein
MIIPKDATIAVEKMGYLLVPKEVDDKSGYLALAGYSIGESWELLRDIRDQLLPSEGLLQRTNEFGDFFETTGVLKGPNGRSIGIRSIWVRDEEGQFRFVTLFPD